MPEAAPEVLIIDYGMGNLRSVEKAVTHVGGDPRISGDPELIRRYPRLILPGVGAFGDAMANLSRAGADRALLDAAAAGTPVLGLCLGLQLLFNRSEEFGDHGGLGLIPGAVRKFSSASLHVPHVGWNQVSPVRRDALLAGLEEPSYFYFVHSYYVAPEDPAWVLATTDYGEDFCSIARRGNVWGAQFHPEKSQSAGQRLLRNFMALPV